MVSLGQEVEVLRSSGTYSLGAITKIQDGTVMVTLADGAGEKNIPMDSLHSQIRAPMRQQPNEVMVSLGQEVEVLRSSGTYSLGAITKILDDTVMVTLADGAGEKNIPMDSLHSQIRAPMRQQPTAPVVAGKAVGYTSSSAQPGKGPRCMYAEAAESNIIVPPVVPAVAADSKQSMKDRVRTLVAADAIRFIKASYMQHLAGRGGIIRRRQELPDDAFYTSEEVLRVLDNLPHPVEAHGERGTFTVVSYAWLSSKHPDPHGHHLRSFTDLAHFTMGIPGQKDLVLEFRAYFWDFMSLHQVPRTDVENKLFMDALQSMHCLYSLSLATIESMAERPKQICVYDLQENKLQFWNVLRLIDVPADAENQVPYHKRGWPTFESAVSQTAGNTVDARDGSFSGSRVPMLPDEFDRLISEKRFTSPKADMAMVKQLYRWVWETEFSQAEELSYLGLRDDEILALVKLLPHFPKLKDIDIHLSIPDLSEVLACGGDRFDWFRSHPSCNHDGSHDGSAWDVLQKACSERGIRLVDRIHDNLCITYD